MYYSRTCLDDLLRDVLEALLSERNTHEASRGKFVELIGCCVHLENPRARLSRSEGKGKVFSALGELLWYLSSDTALRFIDYYVPDRFQRESDDQIRVRSGYGQRLFSFRGINQVENVLSLLKKKSSSRRAVVQLFDAEDLTADFKSVPCTCTLQFIVRDGLLHMFTSMRSNDAYVGFPHDVFAFTMMQELIARSIDVEVGSYRHCAGSMHLYEDDMNAARAYISEGWQSRIAMPPMPPGDPWESVGVLREAEVSLREKGVPENIGHLPAYWRDLVRLLEAQRAAKDGNTLILERIRQEFSSDVYKPFVQARIDKVNQGSGSSAQRIAK